MGHRWILKGDLHECVNCSVQLDTCNIKGKTVKTYKRGSGMWTTERPDCEPN